MWVKTIAGQLVNLEYFVSVAIHKIQENVFQVVACYARHNGFEILHQTKTEKEAVAFFSNLDTILIKDKV